MSSEDDYTLWQPLRRWPDPLTEAFMTAHPSSALFREFLDLAVRMRLGGPSWFFRAADVAGVLEEMDVDRRQLADELGVPVSLVYAMMAGWHRPGLRGLALIADALGVPISRFFVTDDGVNRIQVRRYHTYWLTAPSAAIFVEDDPNVKNS